MIAVLALVNNCQATDIGIQIDDAGVMESAQKISQRIPQFVNDN
jgi:hypothetical protein